MTQLGAVDVVELGGLLSRFVALSDAARGAAVAHDEIALTAALDAREQLVQRIASASRDLATARAAIGSAAARAEFDRAVVTLHGLAEEGARVNSELEASAREFRTDLGHQIDRLRNDEAGRSAYAAAPGTESVLDLLR